MVMFGPRQSLQARKYTDRDAVQKTVLVDRITSDLVFSSMRSSSRNARVLIRFKSSPCLIIATGAWIAIRLNDFVSRGWIYSGITVMNRVLLFDVGIFS